MDYNETEILTAYIWNHYSHLMTSFERQVSTAIIARAQAEHCSNPHMATMLLQRWGGANAPAINTALQDGTIAFRQKVCARLLAAYSDQIFINRCPACQRIVRTPNARLCVWCGHTWYEQTEI